MDSPFYKNIFLGKFALCYPLQKILGSHYAEYFCYFSWRVFNIVSLFVGNLCYYLMEWDQLRLPYLYLFSIFVLLAIGILDDRFDISPFLRAGIQAILAILMIDLGNIYLDHLGQILGPFQLTLGSIGLIITVFTTIAIINAFNMMDGIDGLLGGLP